MKTPDTLLSCKELAFELGRGRTYIFAMKKAGFLMIGNRATLKSALLWLEINPRPRGNGTKRNT